jgi:hypothetical protein
MENLALRDKEMDSIPGGGKSCPPLQIAANGATDSAAREGRFESGGKLEQRAQESTGVWNDLGAKLKISREFSEFELGAVGFCSPVREQSLEVLKFVVRKPGLHADGV